MNRRRFFNLMNTQYLFVIIMNIETLPKYKLRTQSSAISSPLVGKNVW